MFKKSYKGRRIKFAAKKSLAVPVAIVTSFIVILAVSLSTLINKGLVNAFSDSVTPAPSTASTTSESTADLVKSTEISSSKENKANKENVEESKPQSETTGESVEAAEKSQSDTATTSAASTNTDTTSTQNTGTAPFLLFIFIWIPTVRPHCQCSLRSFFCLFTRRAYFNKWHLVSLSDCVKGITTYTS